MNARPVTDPADLDLRWTALAAPAGERLSAERVRDWAGGPVLVAVDSAGVRHLLVRIDPSHSVSLPRPVAGLEICIRDLHPTDQADAAWIDLASGEAGWRRPFSGLCADIITELPSDGEPDPAALVAVLNRWRTFWTSDLDGLTGDEQIGLFGELWLLLEWLPRLTTASVTAWQGPLRGRHDFVTESTSVEVKATRAATGPIVHHINGLDQLNEPGAGQLYLLSLRAVSDPLGEFSLDGLLQQARAEAATTGTTCANLLEERLTAAGVRAADAGRYTETLRVTQQALHRIDDDFPRLVPGTFGNGLPGGIVGIDYSLDMSACEPWLVADAPAASPLYDLT